MKIIIIANLTTSVNKTGPQFVNEIKNFTFYGIEITVNYRCNAFTII